MASGKPLCRVVAQTSPDRVQGGSCNAADRDDLLQEISAPLWRSFASYDAARAQVASGTLM
jgi:hypothetical protein